LHNLNIAFQKTLQVPPLDNGHRLHENRLHPAKKNSAENLSPRSILGKKRKK